MVQVFKTNVTERYHANMLVAQIEQIFADYSANFDLEDCDRILRIKSASGNIHPPCLIELLKDFGFYAEVLADEY